MNIVAAPLRDEEGRLTGVSCYAGHFTSQAMSAPPDDIPVLGERVAGVGSALHFAPGGHAAKALVHVIGQLPRDLLFEMDERSEEHTSELQSLMRISYAVFCLKKKNNQKYRTSSNNKK